jgi:hypothetical protein
VLRVFEIRYLLERPLAIDADRVTRSPRYTLGVTGGKLIGFSITKIEARNSGEAFTQGNAELNAVLGLISLHCQETVVVQPHGIFDISSDVAISSPISTNLTVKAIIVPPKPIVDFGWLNSNLDSDSDVGRGLGMYYVSCGLLKNSFLPEVYLSFYLTLEMLIGPNNLKEMRQHEYRNLRDGLLHTEKLRNDEVKKFLQTHFDSERPSWRNPKYAAKLSSYVTDIKKEVEAEVSKQISKR